MELSFTQNGYFSLKNRQHLFLVVQNASRCFGTKGENHSKNSGGNQKMTPTPTLILQDPPWCSRKRIELVKTTYFTAYRRTLNLVKRSNWPVFVSNLWTEVIITCDLQYFCSNIFIAEKVGERPLSHHGERSTSSRSLDSPMQTAAQSTEQRSLLDGESNLQRRCSEELIETAFNWLLDRWFSWMWRAVSNRSSTYRVKIVHSQLGTGGSSRLTTRRPYFAIVATLRYLLTSFTLLSFLDGRVPCWRCAWVRRKSSHSLCMVSQAVRLVKGRRSSPLSMFCRDERLTAESWACFVKAQTQQTSSS